jgi:outer membrane protein insertion porin family
MKRTHLTRPWALCATLVALLVALPAPATDAQTLAPTVRQIEVEGTRRVDPASIRGRIYTQVGQEVDAQRLSDDIKRIYHLGYFRDVQALSRPHASGGIVLVFRVAERPTILEIKYDLDGTAVAKEEVEKVVDLQKYAILDEAVVQENLKKIDELYVEEGHFLVQTSYSLEPTEDGDVIVTLHVREGEAVQIREIVFVGNALLPSSEIKEILQTREGGYFSFMSGAGQFNRTFFDADVQRIQYFYLTKGFVQIKVDPPLVTLSPDKKSMRILVRVHEGPRYEIGKVGVDMVDDEWLVERDKLLEKTAFEEGDIFDYSVMQADVQRIGDVFRDMGYANATVTSGHDLDPENNRIDITYAIQKGTLVYFNRIEVRGNRGTRDKVVRRELKIHEGELYSATGLRRSRQRIGVLGFFESVELTPRPTQRPDRIDVDIDIKERSTGQFQIGAGFSSFESFIAQAQISKQNFLGRGQTLSAQATLSNLRQLFSLSFYEPYFLDSRVTFAFDMFNYQENLTDFTRLRTGGTLSLGYRLSDDWLVNSTYTLENVDAELINSKIPLDVASQSGVTSSVRGSLSYDTRDNRLFPTRGNYTTVSAEIAEEALGSQNDFTRYVGRTRFYFPIWKGLVFKTNTTMGYVTSPEATPIPLFERFFVGGIFTIRGFSRNSIGERLYIAENPDDSLKPFTIGGTREFIQNVEVEIPVFPEVGIRGVVFFDAGNAWGDPEEVDLLKLHTSAGLGFRWQSPVGPLRFEWGWPLNPRPEDDPMVFEFTIGNSF